LRGEIADAAARNDVIQLFPLARVAIESHGRMPADACPFGNLPQRGRYNAASQNREKQGGGFHGVPGNVRVTV